MIDTPISPPVSDGMPTPEQSTVPAPSTPVPPAPVEHTTSDDTSMPLLDHLAELRTRLMRSLVAICIGFLACYSVAEPLFDELVRPLVAVLPPKANLIYTDLPEAFFVHLKVSFLASLFVVSPYIFYQIWSFIAPGLYAHERRLVVPLAAVSAIFFVAGGAFCYLVVFPFAFTFFLSYSTDFVVAMPALGAYLSFVLKLLLAFGLIFEMPLFAFFLARMGLITAQMMRRTRKYAILAIFIAAAILTPPDVFSQLLMACPMLVLYELSIVVAAMCARKKTATAEPEPATTDTPPEEHS